MPSASSGQIDIDPLGAGEPPSKRKRRPYTRRKRLFAVGKTYARKEAAVRNRIKSLYICNECQLRTPDAQYLEFHKVRVHGKAVTSANYIEIHKIQEPGKPEDCHRVLNVKKLNANVPPQKTKGIYAYVEEDDDWACDICILHFENETELKSHREKVHHAVPNAYACHICEERFDSQRLAEDHLKNNHSL